MKDPYLYDDVPVLKNKGNIKDAKKLQQAEADIANSSMIMAFNTAYKKFDTKTLCDIHRIIFGDIYDFAGEFRSIGMAKSEEVLGGDTVRYAAPDDIKKELDLAALEIAKLSKSENKKDLIFKIVRLTAALWQTHPFREGNTRAVVAFSVLLLDSLGVAIDYALFGKHAAFVRNSLVWGGQGIYSKFEYLERIYFDAAGIESGYKAVDTKDYTVVNGYYVADYKEKPHEYHEDYR